MGGSWTLASDKKYLEFIISARASARQMVESMTVGHSCLTKKYFRGTEKFEQEMNQGAEGY